MMLVSSHSEKIVSRLFLIFVLPIFLLWTGIVEHEFRLFLLLIVTFFV